MNQYMLNNKYEFSGEWWNSNKDNIRYNGTLIYEPYKNTIILDIIGDNDFPDLDFQNDTILGITVDGLKITLLYCIRKKSHSSIPPIKYKHIIHSNIILIGDHFPSYSNVQFVSSYVRYEDQNLFIQKHGFNLKNENENELLLKYVSPERINLATLEYTKIEIIFTYSYQLLDNLSNKSLITQKEYFNIVPNDIRDYDFFRDTIYILRNFLTFVLNKTIYPIEIYFTLKNGQKGIPHNIYLLSTILSKKNQRHKIPHSPLNIYFTITDVINGKLSYRDWYELYQNQRSALDKYFSILFFHQEFIDEEFLLLMQSIEDYYRHSNNLRQTKDKDEIHKNRMDIIVKSVPIEYQNWIIKNLKYSNEINLSWRISNIFKIFTPIISYIIPDKKERNNMVEKLCATRNYLTHHSDNSKEKSVKDFSEYFELNDLLKTVMSLLLLKDLHINVNDIKNLIYKNPYFNNQIRRLERK